VKTQAYVHMRFFHNDAKAIMKDKKYRVDDKGDFYEIKTCFPTKKTTFK